MYVTLMYIFCIVHSLIVAINVIYLAWTGCVLFQHACLLLVSPLIAEHIQKIQNVKKNMLEYCCLCYGLQPNESCVSTSFCTEILKSRYYWKMYEYLYNNCSHAYEAESAPIQFLNETTRCLRQFKENKNPNKLITKSRQTWVATSDHGCARFVDWYELIMPTMR